MNLRRVNTRGIGLANKHVLMAALAYNLKKCLKHIRKKADENAAIAPIPALGWPGNEICFTHSFFFAYCRTFNNLY
jgi:hypothetical protein